MTDRTSGGQQKLEAHVAKTLQENNIQQKDLINGMMQAAVALLIKPLPLLSPFSHGRQIGQDIFTAGSYARHSILRLLHWPVFLRAKTMHRLSVWTSSLFGLLKWETGCWLLQRLSPRDGGSPS